jgi:copper chaperone CopZ
MAAVQEKISVDGIRCERCVMRLGGVLQAHDGLEAANATLMGEVTVSYDDERTTRAALLEAMARGGFRQI